MKKARFYHVLGNTFEIREFLTHKGYEIKPDVKTGEFYCMTVLVRDGRKVSWESDIKIANQEIFVCNSTNVKLRVLSLEEFVMVIENLEVGEMLREYYKRKDLMPYSNRFVYKNRVLASYGEMKLLSDRQITIDLCKN